jgi:predicted component of viral defense system (DUF524 family)
MVVNIKNECLEITAYFNGSNLGNQEPKRRYFQQLIRSYGLSFLPDFAVVLMAITAIGIFFRRGKCPQAQNHYQN